jgi:hypothetical protein
VALRRQDSNLDYRNQNPRCCLYTTADERTGTREHIVTRSLTRRQSSPPSVLVQNAAIRAGITAVCIQHGAATRHDTPDGGVAGDDGCWSRNLRLGRFATSERHLRLRHGCEHDGT